MRYIGIDPGSSQSGIVEVEYSNKVFKLVEKLILENEEACTWLKNKLIDLNTQCISVEVSLEFVQSYGIANALLYQTACWSGEFRRVCKDNNVTIYFHARPKIASYITGSKWKDALVRQALIERIGGTKKGEPLYKVTSHMLPALAAAVYHAEGAVLGSWTQEETVKEIKKADQQIAA